MVADRLRTVCPHDCPDTCSIVATVEDGRVTRCQGDDAHPFTQGFLCHKVAAYAERIYSERRLLHPMIRPRKGAQLERVSWDEALDLVASRLGRGEQVLPYSYGGTLGLVQRTAGHAFFHALGASRLLRTICDDAATAAWKSMVGATVGTDPERVAESDLVVIWGMNADVVNIHLMPFVRAAQRRGARLWVVDPYRTETARMADEHVRVRPGTDAALALGMARVLRDAGRLDVAWIAERTTGFEGFSARLDEYPLERCAATCGVPVADIERFAHALAAARAPYLRLGIGWSRHPNGGQAVRSVVALAAAVGAFPKGGALFETAGAFELDLSVLTHGDFLPKRTRVLNMVELGRVLTADDSVTSLFVYQANPAAICPDQMAVRRGLARADLFVVVHEQMLTDTTDFADVVLPACTSFETSDLYQSYGHYYLQRARPVIPPVGQSRSNVDLFNALARRMGLTQPFFSTTADERIDLLLATRKGALADIDLAALDRGEPVRIAVSRGDCFAEGFPTHDRRFHFAEDKLPDALPGYVPNPEGFESPDRARFPLQLLVPPAKHFLNTTFGASPSLVARQKRPTLLLAPSEAAARGIAAGALVRVWNERGETRAFAEPTDDVPPGLAVLPGVWWNRDVPGGVGGNALTSQRLSDLGSASTFHSALVEVAAAG